MDDRSFEQVCDSDIQTFGQKGSEKRRRYCQLRRHQHLKILKRSSKGFNKLLAKFDIASEDDMPPTRSSTGATMASPEAQKSATKQQQRTPTAPKEGEKDQKKHEDEAIKDPEDPIIVGKWIHLSSGQECYADRVEKVSVDPLECGLNPFVDLIEHIEGVKCETPKAIVKAECVSVMLSAELRDIELGLISLRRTTIPNAVALFSPLLKASLRADINEEDQPDDQKKKLFNAAKNFMMRDPKTKKMTHFWCPEAWERHESVLSKIHQSQEEDGKEFAVAMKVILLVFPSRFRFSCEVSPANEMENGAFLASCEGFKSHGQGISRMRWLLTTDAISVIRAKVQTKEVNNLAKQIANGFDIDEDEDEGMI